MNGTRLKDPICRPLL